MIAPVPRSKGKHLANGLAFIRLVRRFATEYLPAVEHAASVTNSGRFAPLWAGILAEIDTLYPGQEPRAERLANWSAEVAVGGGQRARDAVRSARAWTVMAAVYLDPLAVRVGHRCPECKAESWASGGIRKQALWFTMDLAVCLSCHLVEDILATGKRLEDDGYRTWIKWPESRRRWQDTQADMCQAS